MDFTGRALGVASVYLLSTGLALAPALQPDGLAYAETGSGSQGGGTSSQSNEIEKHWQAVAEITELGGKVTVEGAGSSLRTSVLIGVGKPYGVEEMVEWEGGGEKLVELVHDLINVHMLDVRRYSIDDAEMARRLRL